MITVVKNDAQGQALMHYTGTILERTQTMICLEARFGLPDKPTGYVTFRRGDRFIEWFYADRWYNIFEIHDVEDDHLKGWYCNISRPAILGTDSLHADDLALDVWFDPNGKTLILDEAEFQALPLESSTRQMAEAGLSALLERFERRESPFGLVPAV
jgi:protein associated with RNAse G/E